MKFLLHTAYNVWGNSLLVYAHTILNSPCFAIKILLKWLYPLIIVIVLGISYWIMLYHEHSMVLKVEWHYKTINSAQNDIQTFNAIKTCQFL